MSEIVTCASCVNLDKDGWCEKIADSPYPDTERYCDYHQTATNGDYIRRMTDEELAVWMHNSDFYEGEDDELYMSIYNLDSEKSEDVHDSYGDLLDWLKEEHNVEKSSK